MISLVFRNDFCQVLTIDIENELFCWVSVDNGSKMKIQRSETNKVIRDFMNGDWILVESLL